MRRRAAVAVLALVVGLLTGLATPAAAAVAPPGLSLGLPGYGEMAFDPSRDRLFVSGGRSGNSVAITGTLVAGGTVVRQINNLPGATGLALSADRTRLYVALAAGDAIAVVDPGTEVELARYPTGPQTCPFDLALTGTQLWFSYGCPGALSGKIGLIDLTKPVASAVSFDAQDAQSYARAPLLHSTGTFPVVAVQPGTNSARLTVFTGATTDSSGKRVLVPGTSGDVTGGQVTDVLVAPDNQTVYTAAGSRDRAEAFAAADLTGRGAYAARPRPTSIAVRPRNDYLAVGALTADSNDVIVYRPGFSTQQATHSLAPGETVAPHGLTFGTVADQLFVITLKDNQPQPRLVVIPLSVTA